jgi:hypothetical protein
MNCLESQQLVQMLLDGESIAAAREELEQHLCACSSCREMHRTARRLQDCIRYLKPPMPRPGSPERIRAAILAEHRRTRRRRQAVRVFAVAASLVIAVMGGVYLSRIENPPGSTELIAPSRRKPSLQENVAEAGALVVSLTRRTADETLENTKLLIPSGTNDRTLGGAPDIGNPFEMTFQSLQIVENGVAAGFEPVATSARRAVDLFVREMAPLDGRSRPGM